MQGLSALRVAHCCPSFTGRPRIASSAPQQHLLLLGFRQRSSFFKCGREAFAPASQRLKTSAEDEAVTEYGLPPPAEEEVSAKLAEEDVSTNNVAGEEGPKVKVKFILEKKCRYGQRFNVVGNDPLFGNWEVEAAIPMEWAEGDIWSVEVDVPAEKQVEFKFVLTGESKEIIWQPGSNRIFNTIEGISPLVVNEAWKSADDDEAEEEGGELSDLVKDMTSAETGELLVPAGSADDEAEEEGGELSDLVKDMTSAETGELLVPAGSTEDATIDELVTKAFESNNGADVPKSEPETAPEIPPAELDVVATAVKTALGVDNAA